MDTSAEITILIKYSPKREQMLEQIKELSLSIEDESERNQASRISNYQKQDGRFVPNAFKGSSRIAATYTNCEANV